MSLVTPKQTAGSQAAPASLLRSQRLQRFKMVDSLNNSVACGLVTLGHEMPGFEILLLVRHGSPKLYLSHLPTQ